MLKIDSLSKNYGELVALDSVNLEVNKGELFGLIGPDGAGKTTLFRIAATLMLADSGRVEMDGRDVVNDYEYVRRHIGYMPGKFSLYQDLTVHENLAFFATVFSTTIEENKYLIEDIFKQLEPFQNRKAGALSGGMKQKLALSCALIHKPKLLLLDEPTTGVDAVSRKEFWGMLKNLRNEGITILVSTPYMDESSLCDRVALIQHGRILDLDSPINIVSKFDKDVYRITGDDLYKALKEIRKINGVSACYPFGDSLHAYLPPGISLSDNKELKSLLDSLNMKAKKSSADIEDCFMNLMQNHAGI